MNILTFNPAIASTDDIMGVQSFLATKEFYPRELGLDGEFGEGSTRALKGYKAACTGDVVAVATSQIGAQETPIGSNSGPIVNLYMDATGDRGNREPWCADFVSWCFQRWAANTSKPPGFEMPRTASAFGMEDYGASVKGAKVLQSHALAPQPGDIVVYKFSHVGILQSVGNDGTLHVVEGNTNADGSREGYEVYLHPRYLSSVRSLVRLPLAH